MLLAVASGHGQPPYSTTPGYYSARRYYHSRGRMASFARATGRSATAAVLWMPQGYAQYKALVTGRPFKTKPVDLYLSGQLVNNLRGRAQVNQKLRRLTAWVGFRRQERTQGSGEPITNSALADEMVARGWGRNPFVPERAQLLGIALDVLSDIEGKPRG